MPILAALRREQVGEGARGVPVAESETWLEVHCCDYRLPSAGAGTHDVMLCILFLSSSPIKALFFSAHH